MWPERIIYKINKRTAEKKVILEKKLSLFKLADMSYQLSVKTGAPIFASQGVPLTVEELVPVRLDD